MTKAEFEALKPGDLVKLVDVELETFEVVVVQEVAPNIVVAEGVVFEQTSMPISSMGYFRLELP